MYTRGTKTARVALGLGIILAAAPAGTTAQRTPAPAGPLTSSPPAVAAADPSSRTIRIDAIVTDKLGQPIVDLRAADFRVTDEGVAQQVESAELTANAAAYSPGARLEPAAPAGDSDDAAKNAGARVIALYLDEFHVAAEASARVRQAVSRFVSEHVRPSDLLVVMRPLDSLTDIRFTQAREAARASIASFTGRKDDYTPRTEFEEQYMGRSPAAVCAARAQIVISGVRALGAMMDELTDALSGIVLITEGFNADVPRSRERRLPDLLGLVRASSRQRVMLYTFDPGLPPADGIQLSADGQPSLPAIAGLHRLAKQTGGETVDAGQDLVPALAAVSRDLDSYYVLTYRTTAKADGRFHNVQVTSTRKDARVRVRSGYWAPLPSELRTTSRVSTPPIVPMRALKRSPLINSWIGMTLEPDGSRRIIFTWAPANVAAPNKPLARAEIVSVKVTTLAGAVVFEGDVTAARGASISGRTDSATFVAPTGRLQFDFTISRADGTKLDVGAQDFDVPLVRPGNPVILPPQLFRATSAREFRDISVDPSAAPMPGREFRRTDHMLLRVPAFDPAGGNVQVSAKLINRVGATLMQLSPMPPEAAVTLIQFELPLARFAPGEYSIEVAAESEAGTSRELIRVRITG
jgi:VWFA-related protein